MPGWRAETVGTRRGRCKVCGELQQLTGKVCRKASCQEGIIDRDLPEAEIVAFLERRQRERRLYGLHRHTLGDGWAYRGSRYDDMV
jgi:hypothetical protein